MLWYNNRQRPEAEPHWERQMGFLGFTHVTIYNKRYGRTRYKRYPSQATKEKFIAKVRSIVHSHRHNSSYRLADELSKYLRGWSEYFRHSECYELFLCYIIICFICFGDGLNENTQERALASSNASTFLIVMSTSRRVSNNWLIYAT